MEKMLSARQAARLLNVSERTVRKRIQSGEIPAVKKNGTWQIPLEVLETMRPPTDSVPESSTSPSTEALKARLDAVTQERDRLVAEINRLHERLSHLEAQNERLTMLLAAAQAQEVRRPLPRPLGWVRRLLRS